MRTERVAAALTVMVSVVGLAMGLAACAPAEVVPSSQADGAGSGDAVALAWTAESDCATCHENEDSSMTDATCEISINHGDISCVACHSDTAGLEAVHAEVDAADYKAPKKLSDTEVDAAACEACHDMEAVAQDTATLTLLTDDNGTTVNPHAMPVTEQHESIACASCHDMHSDGDPTTDAPAVCASCHHANVYECYTCH